MTNRIEDPNVAIWDHVKYFMTNLASADAEGSELILRGSLAYKEVASAVHG